LMSCAGLWSCISWRMNDALATYAVFGSAFALYAYLQGDSIRGRLTFGAAGHPNLLAIVCFGALVCALGVRPRVVQIALIGINGLVIINTQGRSCLVASVISVVIYFLFSIRYMTRTALLFAILLTISCTAIAVTYGHEIADEVSAVLLLNDRARGVDSGFTGRVAAWEEAYGFFRNSPIVGMGFRTHDKYMTTLSTAHNGYLSMLAETGIVGFTSIILLMSVCLWRVLKQALAGDRTAILGFSFVSGYLFVSIFERILVNFGSPTSVLMWIFLFMPKWPRPGSSALEQRSSPASYQSKATEAT
jgi:O-antigen ligase